MASYTPNLNLYKPDSTDDFSDFRTEFNNNMDILDNGSGASALVDLTDVDINNPSDGDVLKYDATNQEWVNGQGGSGDVADVEVNGISVVDAGTKIAEITSYEEVTLAEYESIPVAERESNGIAYFIKDLNNSNVQGYPPLIYSDEEREIGVWRDGKPLYQKSFVIDTSNLNTGWNDISSGLSGIDCKDITGKFRFPANDNSIYEFPYTEDSNYCLFGGYKPTNDTIFVYKGRGFATISDFVVTLRYTKTTDTAGSGIWNGQGGYAHHYSTSETVIGTWIDGKPLYEITIDVANPVNDSNAHWIDLTSLSIEECPYLFGYAVRHSGANYLTYYANSIETDGWYYFKARYDNSLDSIMYICLFKNDSISRMKFTIQYTKTTD